MLDFIALAQECAPTVAHQTMAAVVRVESGFNPYAIGVVGGRLERQPKTLPEAVATAEALESAGWNFSLGYAQVNRYNLSRFGLTVRDAFDPCANLRAGSQILRECYSRAKAQPATASTDEQATLRAALSCYYSGNFTRGFLPEASGTSYVQRVLASADQPVPAIAVVPDAPKTSSSAPAVRPQAAIPPAQVRPADNSPVLLRAVRPRTEADEESPAEPGPNPVLVF